jgi:iron complex outermembrane receptor protein
VKQKTLVSAIRKTLGAEILISAAFMSTVYAQSAPTPASGAAAPVAASSAASGKVTQLEKVQVTGSLLKSSDKVGFNQVQVVTAKDITDSGATTVANFLRDVSANSGSSFAENNNNSFAPGGAGIALRGLSEKYTLVLVDGQRVAPYGLAVNGTDNFFDLNTIPVNMVDRIEIVKTGAVSQYGSDAIAGVVNIITKKNFQGVQLDGSLGGGTNNGGNGTTTLGVTAGFGDLNADRFNVTVGASFYKSNAITTADRSFESSQNYLGQPGGQILSGISAWSPNNASFAPLGNCPYGGKVVSASALGPGNQLPGSVCANNTASQYDIQPDEQRGSAKIHATFKIDDTTQAWVDLWGSDNTTTLAQGPRALTPNGVTVINPAGGVYTIPPVVSGSNQYNPYGVDTPLSYVFNNNPWTIKTQATFTDASAGVKGSQDLGHTLGTWDWTASVSHSQSVVENDVSNLFNIPALNTLLGPNGQFNFANPSATPNGLAGLFTNGDYQAISKMDTVDLTTTNSSLFTLPAGDVGLGFGAHFDHESEYIGDIGSVLLGDTAPATLQTVQGQRNVAAVYYQLDVPIINGVTFSQSSRYDHYSDFGGAFSPRFALRWQPVSMLTTYASYSRGFRAPTLIEDTQQEGLSGVPFQNDPYNKISTTGGFATAITQGNPNLQPERTKNLNVGFELSPDRYTDFGLDWYKVIIDNLITTGNAQPLIDANNPAVVVRNPNSTINYINLPYANSGSLSTDGLEATFRRALPTSLGTFTLSGDWAYILSFKDNGTEYAGSDLSYGLPFGSSTPRWKGNTTLAWAYRKFNTTLTWEYTGPMREQLSAYQPQGVASFSQFNLMTTYSGIKHWTIYGGIDNIANKVPPYNAYLMGALGSGAAYDPSQYSDIGRFIQVGATYRF